MIHGEEKTIKTRVGNSDLIYTKRVRFCASHGWIDLFLCPDWEARHGKCNLQEQPAAIGLKLPEERAMGAAA